MKIETIFSKEEVRDFAIKTETYERVEDNGMKVQQKYRCLKWKNKDIENYVFSSRLYSINAENAPAVFKDVEICDCPYPFGNKVSSKVPDNFTMATSLLAFKMGYADGILRHSGGLFCSPFAESSVEAIICVNPEAAQAMRKYTEVEFKDFLDHIDPEDFEFGVLETGVYSSCILGTERDETWQEHYEKCKADIIKWDKEREERRKKEGENFRQSKDDENEERNHVPFETRVLNLTNATYYTHDMYNIWGQHLADHLSFKTREEAQKLCDTLIAAHKYYEEKPGLTVTLVNHKFSDWQREYLKEKAKELREKDETTEA